MNIFHVKDGHSDKAQIPQIAWCIAFDVDFSVAKLTQKNTGS